MKVHKTYNNGVLHPLLSLSVTALAVFAGDSGQLKTGFTFLSTKSLPFCQPNVPLCHLLSAKSPLWKKKVGGKVGKKIGEKSRESRPL